MPRLHLFFGNRDLRWYYGLVEVLVCIASDHTVLRCCYLAVGFFLGEIIGSLITPALCGIVQGVHPGTTCFAIRGHDAGVGRKVGDLLGLLKCDDIGYCRVPTRLHVHFSGRFLNCESNLSRAEPH